MRKVILSKNYMEIFEKEKEIYLQIIPELEDLNFKPLENREFPVISAKEHTDSETGVTIKSFLILIDTLDTKAVQIPIDMLTTVSESFDKESTKDQLLGTKKKYVLYEKMLDIILNDEFLNSKNSIDIALYYISKIKECVDMED